MKLLVAAALVCALAPLPASAARRRELCGLEFGLGGGGLYLPKLVTSTEAGSASSGDLEVGYFCGRFLGALHGGLLSTGNFLVGSLGPPGTGGLGAGELHVRLFEGLFVEAGGGYYSLGVGQRSVASPYGQAGVGWRFDPGEQVGIRLEGQAGVSGDGAFWLWRLTIEIKIPDEQD